MSASTYIVAPAAAAADVPPESLALLELVLPDLAAVEARMNEDLGSDVRMVNAVTRHILEAGGKRLRPAMVALSARAVDDCCDRARIAAVGAAVEFVHMATLVHDDVVDNTARRRGKPTANAVFGNGVAVLTGDYMLARAMRLLALDGDMRIIRAVSEVTIEMSEGEVMEIAATGRHDLAEAEYFAILRKKTASFVEGCCRCGAMLAGADDAAEQRLADYGYRLGMAFQLADDLLDYTGDPAVTGKPRGSDLRAGRATLPFLLALAACTSVERRTLLGVFGKAAADDIAIARCCEVLDARGAFARTRSAACEYVEQAEAAIAGLPESDARACFAALTDYVISRDR